MGEAFNHHFINSGFVSKALNPVAIAPAASNICSLSAPPHSFSKQLGQMILPLFSLKLLPLSLRLL